jgi:hypothetical protein
MRVEGEPKMLNIVAVKPRDAQGNLYIVVDRGEKMPMRYVSATANEHSLSHDEWFWGYYFSTKDKALAHFNAR